MDAPHRDAFEACLTERLISCAESLSRDLACRASEGSLTPAEFIALRELARRQTPTAPSYLAHLMRCSRSQASKIAKRLVSAKYVDEHRDRWTPRFKTLTVTSSGHEALSRAMQTFETDSSFEALTMREQQQLHRLLGRFLQVELA